MSVATYIAVVKDVIVALAAIVAAVVAVVGVKQWRQELRGKAHFDAARNLIRAAYRLRDELRKCRAPLVRASEFPVWYWSDAPNNRTEAEAYAHVYENRFGPVREALRDFEAQALEAETLWGAKVGNPIEHLKGCVTTLWTAMEAAIDDKRAKGENFRADPDFGQKIRAEIAAASTATDNPLSNEIAAAVSGLEENLRMHLER